jgi:hypothetical protein
MKKRYQTYLKKTQGPEEKITGSAFFERMENDKSERDLR